MAAARGWGRLALSLTIVVARKHRVPVFRVGPVANGGPDALQEFAKEVEVVFRCKDGPKHFPGLEEVPEV